MCQKVRVTSFVDEFLIMFVLAFDYREVREQKTLRANVKKFIFLEF